MVELVEQLLMLLVFVGALELVLIPSWLRAVELRVNEFERRVADPLLKV